MLRRIVVIVISIFLQACVSEQTYVDSNKQVRNLSFNSEEAAKSRLLLGLGYLQNNNYSQASIHLHKAKQLAPHRADVHNSLAYYYQQVGEMGKARLAYQTAIGLEPNNPDTLNNYGVFLCQEGEYQNAEAFFMQALAQPDYTLVSESYENLAECALQNNQFEQGLSYFKTALRHNPSNSELLVSIMSVQYAKDDVVTANATLAEYLNQLTTTARGLYLGILIRQHLQLSIQSLQTELLNRFPNSKESLYILAGKNENSEFSQLRHQFFETNDSGFSQAPSEKQQVVALPMEIDEPTEIASTETDENAKSLVVERVDWIKVTPKKIMVPRHKVKPGENLYRISIKYNIQINTLKRWNKLKKQQVNTGQLLYIKNPNVFYVVKEPQKLSTIAEYLKIDLLKLMKWNQVAKDGLVKAGTKILKVDAEKYK